MNPASAYAAFSQPSFDSDGTPDNKSALSGASSAAVSRTNTNEMNDSVPSGAAFYPGSGSSSSVGDPGGYRPGMFQGQDANAGQSELWRSNVDSGSSAADSGVSQSSFLQRPNKPSALKLDRTDSSISMGVADPADGSNHSAPNLLAYNPHQTTPGRFSIPESPHSASNQGNLLTPQAQTEFVSIPHLQPSVFEQMQSTGLASGQPQQMHSVPGLMPAFNSEHSMLSQAGANPTGFVYAGDTGLSGSADDFNRRGSIGHVADSSQQSSLHLGVPASPSSPVSSQFSAPFSPNSTLSGAFPSRPGSRPGSQGLKSVASFTSSTGAGSGAGADGGAGSRPRSSSSGHPATRAALSLTRTGSSGNDLTFSPNANTGAMAHSRSLQNLGAVNHSPVPNLPSPQAPNSAGDGSWGTSSGVHNRPLHGPMFQIPHAQQFNSPTLTSPAQSQHSPQTFFGQSQSGLPFYSPSIDSSRHFGSSSSIASDGLDQTGFSEQRLSAALATSAQISSGTPHANHDGHSTPTIMEEEEDQQGADRELAHPDRSLRSAPSQSQLAQLQLSQQQHQQQQQHALAQRARSAQLQSPISDSAGFRVPAPYQPNMRPRLYQQVSMTELNQMRGVQGLGMSEQPIGDCSSFIQDVIRQYITTPSRLGLGERNVLIMTTKVAQKSYGAEKRFLCPPPMVLLIGSSWWNVCPDASRPPSFQMHGQGENDQVPTVLSPPRLTINISGEPGVQDGALEWASSSGKLIDVGNPSVEMAISGRCIGKQLYISDVDEKRRHVEALVSITVPGTSPIDRRLLGTFASKPIKVISKPSKKRQSSRNTELCVNHGSIISLFHRLRSQTVSTRYLCVSGAPSWFKGSDNQPFLNLNFRDLKGHETPSCFVAKMSSWDPFIIYLVDPKKRADTAPTQPAQPPVNGYPPPPPNALPTSGLTSSQMTVHYNQPIVLQCLNTAVVSPVMVIRKVEKGTTVLGGGSAGGSQLSREAFGDPVSQLHKIALEALEDPSAAVPRPTGDSGEPLSPGQSGPFLACLNESVGMHRPSEPRKWISNSYSVPTTPTTPVTPMNLAAAEAEMAKHMGTFPASPTSMAAAYAAAQTRYSLAGGRGSMLSPSASSSHTAASNPAMEPPPSSDGGKVKRPRRVSSSVVVQKERAASASKNRRRGQSLSVVGMQNQAQGENDLIRRSVSYANSMTASDSSAAGSVAPGAMWSVDVADSDIWTIVGTDIARHSFYVPPQLVNGTLPAAPVADSSISHLIKVPAPSQPITPIPLLHNVVPPPRDARSSMVGAGGEAGAGLVTLFGENFHPNLFVYFGDWKSEHVEVRSRGTIVCSAPPSFEFGVPRGRVPILLVRHDGIIFPTDMHYQC